MKIHRAHKSLEWLTSSRERRGEMPVGATATAAGSLVFARNDFSRNGMKAPHRTYSSIAFVLNDLERHLVKASQKHEAGIECAK
jgi:hypothetical protein